MGGNSMKPLLAFAASFIAMASADQEHYLTAIIMMVVSVVLFKKSFDNEHRGL